MAQGHHAAQGGHQPSQPAPSTHLRDGEAATPSQVVAALSEYMARPNRPKPPTGCAADAVKLFVGNIPKHCTEAVLHKVFQCYGVIVEIAVVCSVVLQALILALHRIMLSEPTGVDLLGMAPTQKTLPYPNVGCCSALSKLQR